jgi:hypothetical protein
MRIDHKETHRLNQAKLLFAAVLIFFLPYPIAAGAYVAVTHGDAMTFLNALGALVVIRSFFALIEAFGSVLLWRSHGRTFLAHRNLESLRANKFPTRALRAEDATGYLKSIEENSANAPELRIAAARMNASLMTAESAGILFGMHVHQAIDDALDVYSNARGHAMEVDAARG